MRLALLATAALVATPALAAPPTSSPVSPARHAATLAMFTLACSTPMIDLLDALRHARVPDALIGGLAGRTLANHGPGGALIGRLCTQGDGGGRLPRAALGAA